MPSKAGPAVEIGPTFLTFGSRDGAAAARFARGGFLALPCTRI